MRAVTLIVAYIALTLLPLILAWAGARPPRQFWDEIASGAGMLAFTIMLVEFVLSGRFRAVSGRIGMDVTMRFHQLLARSVLVLAIVHPFLYQTGFNRPLPWDTTRQHTLAIEPGAMLTGLAGWLLLIVLVILSIGRDKLPYRYEVWRWMHGLGALLIAALILHHTLTIGRYSQDPVLAGLWIFLFAAAALTLAYVYGLQPILQARRRWVVDSVAPAGLKTWRLRLAPVNHRGIAYQAGQFVWLNIGHSAFSHRENPFSISSAPSSGPKLEFIIKELGDFTAMIGSVQPGTRAFIDGPHGNLVTTNREERGIALIAGGVGIAPMLGILRELRLKNDSRPTMLIYGNRREEQIVCRDELDNLARDQGTEVIQVLSEPPQGWTGHTGMIDAGLIKNALSGHEPGQWLFVLCGPPIMMEIVEDSLIALGVPPGQILAERFRYD